MKYIYISLLFTLISCVNNEKEYFSEVPERLKTISKYDNETYIYNVKSLFWHDQKIYAAEYETGSIKVFNSELVGVDEIGKRGEGPGEFIYSPQIYVYKDTLMIFASNKNSFIFHNTETGDFIEEIKIPKTLTGREYKYRFFKENNSIYANSVNLGYYLFEIKDGAFYRGFKNNSKINDKTNFFVASGAHVLNYDNNIYHISDNKPEIIKFNKSGKKVNTFQLDQINAIKERLSFIKKNAKLASNQYYNIVQDVYLNKDKLFILSISGSEAPASNVVSVLDMKNDLKFLGEYKLSDNWYKTIAVEDEMLFAYNETESAIEKFKLRTKNLQ